MLSSGAPTIRGEVHVAFNNGEDLRFDPTMEVSQAGDAHAPVQLLPAATSSSSVIATPNITGNTQNTSDDPPWPFAEMPTEMIGRMQGKYTSFDGGIYELRKGDKITTDNFATPIAFQLIAKTNSRNLRIGYIEKEIIFNWEGTEDEDANDLRIGSGNSLIKGPFDGRHVPHKGKISIDTWVTITLIASLDSLEIWAEGSQRFFGKADLSRFNEPFAVFQRGSIIQVKSLLVGRPRIVTPKSMLSTARMPAFNPQEIIYAEWGATKDRTYYRVNATRGGEKLSEKIKPMFRATPPEKLLSATLDVRDPIDGPHKQLKFLLSDDRRFSLDEYGRITIDSCIPITLLDPSNELLT
jgi:hypothetical protein